MRPKPRVRSLTLRLFTTVTVVLLTLNVLSILSTLRLTAATRASMLREHSYVQSLYVNQLDRELAQTQTRLYSMSRSYDFSLALSRAEEGPAQYDALRSQVALNTEMKDWLAQFPLIDGYFIYQPEGDILIISGDDTRAIQEVTARLKDPEQTEWLEGVDGKWALHPLLMGDTLMFSGTRRGTRYGAWVQTDRLLAEWGLQEDGYQLLTDMALEEAGTVDVPSAQAQCLLRYRLPDAAVSLPTSVKALAILSVVMLLSIPFIWLTLRKLVLLPLRDLMEAIQRIESGDTAYRIPEKTTSSEFDRLNAQFNRSVEQLAGMRMEMYETQLENERTQVRYLSQQMQPHFVLNTLNLIYSMEPEEYDLIQSTVVCLSDYYRYVTYVNDPLVPLEAELNHVEYYFKLQQTRYPNVFFYAIRCPDDLRSQMIPPIVIQTFAENAIKHSLKPGERNEVLIQIEKNAEEQLHVLIRDSGSGYPEEILRQVRLFQQTREKQPDLGIGIQNTIERIRLIYKDQARLFLSNAPEGGAQVDLYFPMKEERKR